MLVLFIQARNRQQQVQTYQCMLNQLETALSTLTLIAAAGNVLLEIYIVEDEQRTNLSPQAFDGQDMALPLRALQKEWEALLSQAEKQPLLLNGQLYLEMTLQRIDQLETQMAEYDGSITKFRELMLTTEKWLQEGPRRERLLSHYHAIVSRHYQSIERVATHRDKLLRILTKLQ